MKRLLLSGMALLWMASAGAQTYETRFARSLHDVLNDLSVRFGVRFKYDVDTVGRVLPYADFRVRPYSLEESLTNVLAPFDYKYVKQREKLYKIKPYEYARRTEADGEKLLTYLSGLYDGQAAWEQRKEVLHAEVRQRLGWDEIKAQAVKGKKPICSRVRKYNGYSVQNFALETLPGLYVCGSVYRPLTKGPHAFILCPNGHFAQGRYREDQQQRMGTLARMGAICVDYDLYGWGESALQVGAAAHHTSDAHVIQALNGCLILDYMLATEAIDPTRIGVNGGSGGGTQTVLLTVLDPRFTAAAPVVSLSAHFDGGCPCESGKPIQLAGGGTCNAELAALFAPRPLLVVSDGGDWTASVPRLEYPFLQRIYGFYAAADRVDNVHLPAEGHDFGPNKRHAVYDFFARVFALDAAKIDETKVTIEPENALKSFGDAGEKLPAGAIRERK